jgi:hypothetical protein
MIDTSKIQALIDECPINENVRGIVTLVDFETGEDWAGDETVFVNIHMNNPNSAENKSIYKAIEYADCIHAKLLGGGIFAHIQFQKSRSHRAAVAFKKAVKSNKTPSSRAYA